MVFSQNKHIFILIFILIVFVIIKIPHLFLPYYWDEAWAYGPAVQYMYHHKLSLLPSAIPDYFSRGHPPLFIFLTTLWIKIFGNSLPASHSFPLLISLSTIILVYFFCIKFFNRQIGLMSAVFLCVQSLFLTHSAFLFHEILLTFFFMAGMYVYFTNNRILFVIFSTLGMLTKEPAIILILTIMTLETWTFFRFRKISFLLYLKQLLIISLGIWIFLGFLFLQKMEKGWYFMPGQSVYFSTDIEIIIYKFIKGFSHYLFISYGRYVLSITVLCSIIFIIWNKIEIKEFQRKIIYSLFVFIVLYMFSFSFFTDIPRYLLPILPLFTILSSFIIYTAFKNKMNWIYFLSGLIILFQIFFCINKRDDLNDSLGFIDAVKVHQQVISYCELQQWYEKSIYTHFLMEQNLTSPYSSYIGFNSKKFLNVSSNYDELKEIAIISSVEFNPAMKMAIDNGNFKLLEKFQKNNSWSEVYIKNGK